VARRGSSSWIIRRVSSRAVAAIRRRSLDHDRDILRARPNFPGLLELAPDRAFPADSLSP
jgi:hypothetical protein